MSDHVKHSRQPDVALFLLDLDGGGAERAILRLAGDIAGRGIGVDLVVGDVVSDYQDEIDCKVRVENFSTRSPFEVLLRLAGYLRSRRPRAIMSALDVANVILMGAARLARYNGRTIASQRAVVDASLMELPRLRRAVTARLLRACLRRADSVISNSAAASRDLIAMGIAHQRITIIPNAIDIECIERLSREPLSDSGVSDRSVPLIVSVGSLTRRKDMETLIRAFAETVSRRSARLVIVGKGEEHDRLSRLISDLGIEGKARLAGFDTNPYRWIAAGKVFASSSTGEGFPNVIAEALALGRSIVATDCPGDTGMLLEHGKWGRLVPVGDPRRMADALIAALDDREEPKGRLRAADFAPERITTRYLSVMLPDPEAPDRHGIVPSVPHLHESKPDEA